MPKYIRNFAQILIQPSKIAKKFQVVQNRDRSKHSSNDRNRVFAFEVSKNFAPYSNGMACSRNEKSEKWIFNLKLSWERIRDDREVWPNLAKFDDLAKNKVFCSFGRFFSTYLTKFDTLAKKVIHFLEILLVFRQICLLLWPFFMRLGQMFTRPNSEKIINPFGHTATEWNSIFKIFVFFNKRLNVSVGCSNAERMARSEFISSFELFFSPPPRRRRRHLFSFCNKTFWKSTLLSKSL